MAEIRFSKEHEWVRVEGDVGVCGVSDYAQSQLGDVVFVELPEAGRKVSKAEEVAVVESVKAASDVYAPVSGEVVAVNDALGSEPGTVNADPLGEGWFFKIRLSDTSELGDLMTEEQYRGYIEGLA